MDMHKKREMRSKKKQENDNVSTTKTNINWFPGHMTKAKREIQEYLKLVDFTIELRDARIPISSKNPLIEVLTNQKPRLIILTKKDKADPIQTKKWIEQLSSDNTIVFAVDHFKDNIKDLIIKNSAILMKNKIDKMISRGINPRAMRAMVLGIPNVGKSTMINRFSNKKITEVSDRPGVTRHLKWVKLNKDVELLDTPGILWPKFEDQNIGYKLAIIGSINDNVIDLEDISYYLIDILKSHYPNTLVERYDIDINLDRHEIFKQIGENRKWFKKNNEIDVLKTSTMFLNEFRDNKIGNLTLEFTNDNN